MNLTNNIFIALTSTGSIDFDGKKYNGIVTGSSKLLEIIDGEIVFQETTDEIPATIKKVMERESIEKSI